MNYTVVKKMRTPIFEYSDLPVNTLALIFKGARGKCY